MQREPRRGTSASYRRGCPWWISRNRVSSICPVGEASDAQARDTRWPSMAVTLLVLLAAASARGASARSHVGDRRAHVETADSSTTVLLGDQAVEPHQSHLNAGQTEAFRLRAHTSGITSVVYIYLDSGNSARAVAVGIYSDARGQPGSLLSEGSGSSLELHGWRTVSVTPTQLASGRTYWLAVLGEDGTLRYRSRRRGPCLSAPSIRAHHRELPLRWSAGSMRARTHCPISAYVAAADFLTPVHPTAPGPTASPLEPSLPVGVTPASQASSPPPRRNPCPARKNPRLPRKSLRKNPLKKQKNPLKNHLKNRKAPEELLPQPRRLWLPGPEGHRRQNCFGTQSLWIENHHQGRKDRKHRYHRFGHSGRKRRHAESRLRRL